MKIAIPVNDRAMDSGVCMSFGRAPYYLIYDTAAKEGLFLDNAAAKSAGGAGIKAAQLVADSGADALITPRCGENAANVLMAAGIKLYKTTGASLRDNIEAFLDGALSELAEIHAGMHGQGGR